jgi:hypothetical protein
MSISSLLILLFKVTKGRGRNVLPKARGKLRVRPFHTLPSFLVFLVRVRFFRI